MTTELPAEQLAYEMPETWDPDWFPAEDHERVRQLATLLPPETRSLLDVGCGNGLFLNHLKRDYPGRFDRLCGFDRSVAALAHVETEKRQGKIDALPFRDGEFDTINCSEVLEHIPTPIYRGALAELARVAERTIMVCVPYNQNLEADLSKCPCCLARFNADFHVRSYDNQAMQTLFDGLGFGPVETLYMGARVLRYDQVFRARLSEGFHRPTPQFPSYALCPVCGYRDAAGLIEDLDNRKRSKASPTVDQTEHRSPLRRWLANAMPAKTMHRWVVTRYQRGH